MTDYMKENWGRQWCKEENRIFNRADELESNTWGYA